MIDPGQYFKFINHVFQDVEHELSSVDILKPNHFNKIVDLGCGTGKNTFALVNILNSKECVGIDKFDSKKYSPKILSNAFQAIKFSKNNKKKPYMKTVHIRFTDLNNIQFPTFQYGNILTNLKVKNKVDLVYMKKTLANLYQDNKPTRTQLIQNIKLGLNNIASIMNKGGQLISIEYKGLKLEEISHETSFKIIKEVTLNQNEIRSRGRTKVKSEFEVVLLEKM